MAARPRPTKKQFREMMIKLKLGKDTIPWEPQPNSPLLSLPGELLNEIYHEVLITDTPKELNEVARPPIVAVCRQTRQEATQIFLKGNKFIWKLNLKADWTLKCPARHSLPKWLRHAATAEAPAYFGELVIWLVAPPKSRAFDYLARLSPTPGHVRLDQGVYHKFNYVYCTTAQANFCRRGHTCNRGCGGQLFMVGERWVQILDRMFSGLEQLRLPELGILDLMALGKAMTGRVMSTRQKCMLRSPVCREMIWKRVYAPADRSEMGDPVGGMEEFLDDRGAKKS